MNVPPLTFRIPKGAPLTSAEHDENLKLLRDFVNGLARLFELVFNPDGTLKDDSIGTDSIQDRAVTQRKLDWLANFYGVASGVDNYTVTINPNTGFGYGDGATTSFFCFIKFTSGNTAAVTLDVNGGGPKSVRKDGADLLVAGDITAGAVYPLIYDGTNFQLLSRNFTHELTSVGSPVSSDSPGANASALSGPTLIGSCDLVLPANTTWSWVKVVYAAFIDSSGVTPAAIGNFVIKIGSDVMGWVTTIPAGIFYNTNSGDDAMQVVLIAEGIPAGHETDSPLTIDVYAEDLAAHNGDTAANRSMYVIGQTL